MMTLALLAGLYMFITAGRFGPALKLLIFCDRNASVLPDKRVRRRSLMLVAEAGCTNSLPRTGGSFNHERPLPCASGFTSCENPGLRRNDSLGESLIKHSAH